MTSEIKDSAYEFNCPQFVDFADITDDNADSYFDTDHESGDISNDRQSDYFLKSSNLRKTVKSDGGKKTWNFHQMPGGLHAKRNPLGAIQTKAAHQKDYELRLTPYRQERSEAYCSTYLVGSEELLKSTHQRKSEKENMYNLRMTPARKRKTKSCFMFRDVGLAAVAKHAILNDSDDAVSPELEPMMAENECHEMGLDCTDVSSTSSTSHKRAGSPVVEAFPVKRAKLDLAQPQNLKKKLLSDESKKYKTSEERELMKINQLRRELAQKRARNEKYMHRAINADFSRGASQSTMSQHTVIKPFHFKTDERIKGVRPAEEYKSVDFSSMLRRKSPRVTKSKLEPTKFQPFHFATDKRIGQQDPNVGKVDNKGPKKKITTMGLSLPQSPNLRTVKRNRPITALSRQQVEDLEVQEMNKYKFHAKDFDPTSFAKVLLPRVSTKPSTKPEAIELATEKRFKNKETKKPDEQKFEFHAQPVPKQILTAPTGLKPKPAIPQTEPKSPAFALKLRSQKWKELSRTPVESNEHQVSTFKAHPVPNFKVPAPVKNVVRRCTVMEPFSFDQKDQERAYLKELKVSEEIEKQKQAYNFRAQPLPDLSGTSGIPKKETKPATKPQPFQLQIDKLAEHKIDKWQKEIESQLAEERAAAVFKANPSTVTKRAPFQPEKSTRPLTVSNNVQLETEKRAEERLKYEEHLHSIDAENRANLLRMREEKEKQEKEEIALLRRQTVHKANPVRHYKSVEIKPSTKPLTQPSSPCFATDLRAKPRV